MMISLQHALIVEVLIKVLLGIFFQNSPISTVLKSQKLWRSIRFFFKFSNQSVLAEKYLESFIKM